MASGWAPDGAVHNQIDDSITDAVRLARARLPTGPGEINCQDGGDEIPEARRKAMPGARTCVACQSGHDANYVMSGARALSVIKAVVSDRWTSPRSTNSDPAW